MKLILRSVLLWLALVTPALAQNIESYVLTLPPGLSLIANQLDRGANTLNEIMPVVPDGSVLKNHLDVTVATYSGLTASWSPADIVLAPGKGLFFENNSGAPFTLTFTGTRRVPVWPIPEVYQNGLHIVSIPIPIAGDLNSVPILGIPCGFLTISKWNGTGWDRFSFDPENGFWGPSVPAFAVGEAFGLDVNGACPGPPPFSLNCPAPKTVQCGTDWTFDSPVPLNPCEGPAPVVNVVSTVTNGTCPLQILRAYEATDACGTRATCTQLVTVIDNAPPQLVCPADKTVECGSVWSFDAPTATDSCSGDVTVNVVSTATNGTCPATITRAYEAIDACGNRSTCSQTVHVTAPAKGDLCVEDTPYNYNGEPDLGREPDVNMANQSMWLSRSIWVHQDCAQAPGTFTSQQNPRYGQTNCILVKVSNIGSGLVNNAKLVAYVANASLGLSWPSGWTPIRTNDLPGIEPGASHIAQFPWWPEGTGHYCLLARIVSDEDPMKVPEAKGISGNVRTNNNLAWRNVNVVNLLLASGQSAEVRVKPVRNRVEVKPGQRPPRQPVTIACKTEAIFHEGAGEATLHLGTWFNRWQEAGGRGHGFQIIATGNAVRITNVLARLEGIPMDQDEEAIINLVVKGPHPLPLADTEHTCHVELTEEIDGEPVGGVNYGVRMRALHTDTDKDGIVDVLDPDDDGDGVADVEDPDPLGEPDCPPSALTIRSVDGNMVLTWNGLGYRLEATSVLGRAWRPLHGALSPYVVAPTEEELFFRLVCH